MSTEARIKEYYNFDEIQRKLYEASKQNRVFKDLLEIISSDENILLAYITIKRNKGAKTQGTDRRGLRLNCLNDSPGGIHFARNAG